MKQIKQLILPVAAALTTLATVTSCDDFFDIKPSTELVSDDFWQSKNDVESSVAACYRAMMEPGVMERLIVWGEVRSDNVLVGYSASDDISRILSANLDATNAYTQWGSLYSVINDCNTVLENAPSVIERDPNFKQGELRAYQAEALTLRALCYFYLVRTFRDVPFITEPYTDDTRSFQVAQTDGDAIIDTLLMQLEEIQATYPRATYTSTADTKGRVTQKTVWTLMADMYLWRNQYDKTIEYCEKVLDTTTNPLQLETAATYNLNVFGTGNSTESIFELQFSTDTPDYVVNEMYGTSGGRSYANHLSAADFSNMTENPFVNQSTDVRYYNSFYTTGSSAAVIPIKKYISYRDASSATDFTLPALSDYYDNANTQHWVIYRLSDVYLMEAEALAERGSADDIDKAYELVSCTYDRAHPTDGQLSLEKSKYSSQSDMRELVFKERQVEFLFEGKRYFDLLRRIRRENNLSQIVSSYLLPKYASVDQSTAQTKLSTLNALYMPINKDELELNKLLNQNPFYEKSSDIEKVQ